MQVQSNSAKDEETGVTAGTSNSRTETVEHNSVKDEETGRQRGQAIQGKKEVEGIPITNTHDLTANILVLLLVLLSRRWGMR